MPMDKERYPGRFPVWMQLGYAKALKEPDKWHEVMEFWSEIGTETEVRKFRAFRRSVKNPAFVGWEKTIRPDADEFQSRVRVREETVVVSNWSKLRRVVEIMCYKGPSKKQLRDERQRLLVEAIEPEIEK